MLKLHDTTYEAWWQGADGKWRPAKSFMRADRLMDYLRLFIERYPGVGIRAFKRWTIRHALFELKNDENPPRYPDITLNQQLELNDSPSTHNGTTDSIPAVSTEPLPGRRNGGEGTAEGDDDHSPGKAGRGNVDCQEPARPSNQEGA